MGRKNIIYLILFSIFFAYLESAVVVYLRTLSGKTMNIFPMQFLTPKISLIELGREAATIIILLSVSALSERKTVRRIYAFLFAFGIWDVFYYLWLKVFINWPSSLLDYDVLFLIPLPWIGPVMAPFLISLAFIFAGFFILLRNDITPSIKTLDLVLMISSSIILIFNFIYPSVNAVKTQGIKGLESLYSVSFNWTFYLIGFLLLSFSIFMPLFRKKEPLNPYRRNRLSSSGRNTRKFFR